MVFGGILKFFRELDSRIKVLYSLMGIHTANQQLTVQYNQLYAVELGANPVEVGTLNSVGRLAGSLISIPSGWLADRYGAKKVVLIGLAFIAVIATIYGFANSWFVLIPALLLFGAGMRLIMPFVDIFLINLAKPEQRATIMSISRAIWAIPRIIAPIVAAVIVTHFGGLNVAGIRPLYYVQLILAIFVFVSVALWLKTPIDNPVKNTEYRKVETEKSFIQDFQDLFKGEKWLKRWMIVFATRSISINIASSFVTIWMVNVKKADPYVLGAMAAIGMITFTFFQIPAGRLSDKIGRKKAYYLFRPFTFIADLLLIFAPNPESLILVGILGGTVFGGGMGGIGGVGQIPFITMEHELVPAEKRGRWQGVLGVFQILTFPASILGGIMWQQGLMKEVLLLPVILEALIAMPILNTIPDTLK